MVPTSRMEPFSLLCVGRPCSEAATSRRRSIVLKRYQLVKEVGGESVTQLGGKQIQVLWGSSGSGGGEIGSEAAEASLWSLIRNFKAPKFYLCDCGGATAAVTSYRGFNPLCSALLKFQIITEQIIIN